MFPIILDSRYCARDYAGKKIAPPHPPPKMASYRTYPTPKKVKFLTRTTCHWVELHENKELIVSREIVRLPRCV